MGYCVEFVRFTVEPSDVDEFIQRRQAAITEVKAAHPGLRSVPVCARRDDRTWLEVWIYETREAADAANADAENLPQFMAMAALLGNIEIEAAEMPATAISPLISEGMGSR
ncbi:antibiotic biosynthesis monooxygenase [Gordonia sp. NPDC003376]